MANSSMNRRFCLCLGLVGFAGSLLGQETAYRALRAVGNQQGEKTLNRVVGMYGRSGQPQPADWKIEVEDPAARGGIREFDVVGSQIAAERTPVNRPDAVGARLDLNHLNLDSDGAFRIAENEAKRNRVGFDTVTYTLAADPQTGKPIWTLQLFDVQHRSVGLLRVAADNGTLLAGESWSPGTYAQVRSDGTYSDNTAPPGSGYNVAPRRDVPDADADSDRSGGTISERANRYGSTVVRFGKNVLGKTERAARRIGGWFQKRITGKDTISPDAGADEEDEPDREQEVAPPLDPYSQPVRPVPAPQ